jgi:hypothetical protein
LTRRQFIIGGAGLILALKAGLPNLQRVLSPEAKTAVGPMVLDELKFVTAGDNCEIWHEGELLLETNELGGRMLAMADGTRTLLDISGSFADKLGLNEQDRAAFHNETALFFVEAGTAGFLQNLVLYRLDETVGCA